MTYLFVGLGLGFALGLIVGGVGVHCAEDFVRTVNQINTSQDWL